MKKRGVIVLFSFLLIFSLGLALNPVDFVPADIDFALELSYPKTIMEQTGMEDEILSELSGMDFLNYPIQNAKMALFGKFGLSDLLIGELDFYDFEDVLDSPEMLLSLSTMPIAILTNLINVEFILEFLEGEFMAGALEEDVYIKSETIDKAGYETKHFKIRYYGNSPSVFLDLFFVKLEENYTLFSSSEDLLDKALDSAVNESKRFTALQSSDPDSFLKIANNGINFSWFIMRLLGILDGKSVSEMISAGVRENTIYVDLLMEMQYSPEGAKEVLEKTQTDYDHYNCLPDFEDIRVYTSLPQTGLSIKSFLDLFGEILGENIYDYTLEEIMAFPASLGPEVERYDMYLMGSEQIPYLLLKVEDATFIFDNYVKDNWLEAETAETVSFTLMDHLYFMDNLYLAYDSRYDYIEVFVLTEENQERLNNGILYFTEEMAKEKEQAHHIPENVWGMFMYEDLVSLIMDYDETGNFKISATLSLEAIMNELAMGQSFEEMQEIIDFYLDMNYAIQDEIYYTPDEEIDIQQLLNNSYIFDYYDEDLIQSFKIQTGQKDDAFIYYIYYDGPLPEGLTPEDLSQKLSNDIYDENVEITVKSGNVVLEIHQTR
ncbi:MAG: hypothetical protein U9N62_04070 [Thermotogota bacterium]|nr:hypothetical protein [Thermotogota bacterium]